MWTILSSTCKIHNTLTTGTKWQAHSTYYIHLAAADPFSQVAVFAAGEKKYRISCGLHLPIYNEYAMLEENCRSNRRLSSNDVSRDHGKREMYPFRVLVEENAIIMHAATVLFRRLVMLVCGFSLLDVVARRRRRPR